MININFMGHDLYRSDDGNLGFFLCKKCSVKIDYLEGDSREYLYVRNSLRYAPDMTCDEFIIKDIIE
jgi:hypothetical protein